MENIQQQMVVVVRTGKLNLGNQ
jgi:ribosomal protein L30E